MEFSQYDTVLLKDGREAVIVEVDSPIHFTADIGDSSKDWDTIPITLDMIKRRICNVKGIPYAEKDGKNG